MRDELEAATAAIREALGGGAAFAPQPLLADHVPDGTALVVRTSGSTGAPREVALSVSALRASAAATHERLGGPGRWFLALPVGHVAGLQVISRSVVAGTRAGGGARGPFTPDGFAAEAGKFLSDGDGHRTYVSLVPTQAHRLVEAADAGAPEGLDTLARFDAVLLGGAATPLPLRGRLRDAGVRAVATYGMSETCGGCVYDGVPLPGVRVRLAEERPGVVEISGPMLATGYLGSADAAAATRAAFRTGPDGTRWFRTSDLGSLDAGGHLTILGRADDVIVTGGVNVAPAAVEAVLAELGEVCVVGVPDPEWGQAVVAVLAAGDGTATSRAHPRPPSDTGRPALAPATRDLTDRARDLVTSALGRAAAPRRLYLTPALPLRGPGKPDRAAVEAAVSAELPRATP
ncbi:AMP-binding protein [Myceligenerans xiligouense]|uniref:O-succinylbenzoic acid--CoA ligase n=1 Tax=Myceligenerans xiligouense TaxID=253184 RepID=A0A3N4YRZ1_9MICO|nr:AMP-binding protein [Myceligenerans xiligouense]RPF22977.1 O-succinylbenzoic acid--CoA ligase [Myceligenerans xiligouense]